MLTCARKVGVDLLFGHPLQQPCLTNRKGRYVGPGLEFVLLPHARLQRRTWGLDSSGPPPGSSVGRMQGPEDRDDRQDRQSTGQNTQKEGEVLQRTPTRFRLP